MLVTRKSKSFILLSGFTLLEVLITLIVLSVGLLGLAGLQTMSLRNNHDAYLRNQATIQANDLVERLRGSKVIKKKKKPTVEPYAEQIEKNTLTTSAFSI